MEQRKATEAANKERAARQDIRNSNNSNGFHQKEEEPKDCSAPKKKEPAAEKQPTNATAKKATARKLKSEVTTCSVLEDVIAKEAEKIQDEADGKIEKKTKKLNYNVRDKSEESDAASDSEPSEDNLDEGEMMKIIPKKFGKKKFLKGVDEKKKKPAPPAEPKKKVEKKPKTELMPCLQSKRKELDEKKREAKEKEEAAAAKQAAIKKVASISKPVLHTKRNGVHVRDVATQIKYIGDGTQLSLMEIDIMNHTGCRWSRVIYPGFKGYLKPQDKHDMHRSVERNAFPAGTVSPNAGRDSLVASFNAELSRLVGDGLRSQSKKPQASQEMKIVMEAPEKKALSAKKESVGHNRVIGDLSDQKVSLQQFFSAAGAASQPVTAGRSVQPFGTSSAGADSKLQSLQQRILDGNFAEPRSLIGGFSAVGQGAKNRQLLRQNAFEYGSAGTGKGKPGDMCIKATTKFEQPKSRFEGDLETVHEKAHDRSTVDLLTGGGDAHHIIIDEKAGKRQASKDEKFKRNNVSNKRGASLTNTPAGQQVKKMVNGSLVTQIASSVLTNSVFVKSQQKQEHGIRLRSKVASIGSAQLLSLSASAN